MCSSTKTTDCFCGKKEEDGSPPKTGNHCKDGKTCNGATGECSTPGSKDNKKKDTDAADILAWWQNTNALGVAALAFMICCASGAFFLQDEIGIDINGWLGLSA